MKFLIAALLCVSSVFAVENYTITHIMWSEDYYSETPINCYNNICYDNGYTEPMFKSDWPYERYYIYNPILYEIRKRLGLEETE